MSSVARYWFRVIAVDKGKQVVYSPPVARVIQQAPVTGYQVPVNGNRVQGYASDITLFHNNRFCFGGTGLFYERFTGMQLIYVRFSDRKNRLIKQWLGWERADLILKKILTNSKFEQIITGDNVQKGKPDPQAFNLFLSKTGLKPEEVIVVENSPLGVQAARNSKMRCILTLNNSPLDSPEFKNFIDEENIFGNTYSLYNYLSWCNN